MMMRLFSARRLAVTLLALLAWGLAPASSAWAASSPPIPVSLPYFAGIGAQPATNTIQFYDANLGGSSPEATLPSGGWPSPYSSAQPQSLAIAADGTAWVAGYFPAGSPPFYPSTPYPFVADLNFSSGSMSATPSYQMVPQPQSYNIAIGPDGGLYYCATNGSVYRLDPATGNTVQAIASSSFSSGCQGGVLQFEPDGFLYVGDGGNNVRRFTITVTIGSGGPSVSAVPDSVVFSNSTLTGLSGIAEGPDGDVYISGATSNNVLRLDGTTGAFKTVVINASTSIIYGAGMTLGSPGSLAFGPDGDLYVDSGGATTGAAPSSVYPGIVQVDLSVDTATAFTYGHIVSMIFQDHPPAYSVPQTGPGGTRLCPSPDMSAAAGISPSGTGAYGQTLAEVNPFDPIHQTAPCDPGGVPSGSGGTTYLSWSGHTPALAPWVPTRKPWQQYNLFRNISAASSDYTPYNGRWVTLYTQIPADYSVPSANPNGPWWYLRYQTDTAGSFTDRTTIELQVLDSPPRLIN